MLTSSWAVFAAALLSSAGLANAGCQNDVACQKLGCKDDPQIVIGNTEIKEPRTTPPVSRVYFRLGVVPIIVLNVCVVALLCFRLCVGVAFGVMS